ETGSSSGVDLTRLTYDENGVLLSEEKFRNEKPHGTQVFNFPGTKTPRIKESYEEGKRMGIRYTYHANGKVATEETYKFDLLAGPSTTYYENGKIASRTEYRNSRKHGLHTAWYPNGKIREQGEYVAD